MIKSKAIQNHIDSHKIPEDIVGQVYTIDFHVNDKCEGPICDGSHTYILYEVWDELFQRVEIFETKAESEAFVKAYNEDVT